LATWNRGLCKLIVNSDSLLTPAIDIDILEVNNNIETVDKSRLGGRFIVSFKDKDGSLWLGSYADGLIKMKQEENGSTFFRYNLEKGAPNNSVYGIAGDNSGNIWISTNHGIGKFNPVMEQFNNYFISDGLQSNSFMWRSYFQADNEIYFGGDNGLTVFNPDSIYEIEETPEAFFSKLYIKNDEVQVNEVFNGRVILDKNIRFEDQIELMPDEKSFALEISAFEPYNPEEIYYLYKLEGFDEDWILTNAKQRLIPYTNLKNGTYIFKAKASNSDGVWNIKPASIKITILPHWWQTWWAKIVSLILFAMFLVAFRYILLMRVRLKHEAKMEQVQRKKTEELYHLKMRFFTNISHEFRTPLTLILVPLQNMIEDLKGDKRYEKALANIARNTNRLSRLIDQVIEFRKIEAKSLKVNATNNDIVKFTRELVSDFGDYARGRGIALDFYSFRESIEMYFDTDKLDKILYNLISNAFKYTSDNGKIHVSISSERALDESFHIQKSVNDKKFIKIVIADTGLGIAKGHLGRIFDRFYTIENPGAFRQSGSGIGLSLVKELVELHNGRIEVESQEGEGTVFSVFLPVDKDQSTEIHTGDGIIPESSGGQEILSRLSNKSAFALEVNQDQDTKNRPSVLLVEDEFEMREFLCEIFSQTYRLITAKDGMEGLKMARKYIPDIVISDIMMPKMDGLQMCHKIKTEIRTSHIPVVLLSAKANLESIAEGYNEGADVYVTKPFSEAILKKQVENVLNGRQLLRKKFSKEFLIQPENIAISSRDEIFLKKAIKTVEEHMEDHQFSSELFCEKMGMSRSNLHNKLKKLTSLSSSEFIRNIRLKRASSLLKDSQFNVEEVAYKVGFNSPAYFSKCFKLLFGSSPKEYISNHSGT
jgi:signal transduction histidine kinase/DNA-binding response OmpR family regulator